MIYPQAAQLTHPRHAPIDYDILEDIIGESTCTSGRIAPCTESFKTMPTFKITYDVKLKPGAGSFCTGPMEIMRQMDDAQKNTLRQLRDFLKNEGIEKDVTAISPITGQIGIAIHCSDSTAQKIAAQKFVTKLEPYTPPPPQKKQFPKFKF